MLSDCLTNKQSVVYFKVYILTLEKQRRDGGSLENGDCDKRNKFAILWCRKLTVGKGSALILRQARRKDLQYSYHSEVTTLEETAPVPCCAQRTVCTASNHLSVPHVYNYKRKTEIPFSCRRGSTAQWPGICFLP